MTTISSATQTVTFGPGQPMATIGERINPTGKSKLSQSLRDGDLALVVREAERQVAAGAQVLDVNVGAPGVDETVVLSKAVEAVASRVEVPLAIDSSSAEALAAALAVYKGKALVNSVTGEERSLERILPVVKAHGAAIVGMLQDEDGIPCTAEGRLAIARRIVQAGLDHGIPREDLVIDCACLSAGADPTAPQVTLETIRLVGQELGVSTMIGASNVSFGLPGRKAVNAVFLAMAIEAGVSAAIVDPTVPEVLDAVVIADMLAGHDDFAMRYLQHYRAHQPTVKA